LLWEWTPDIPGAQWGFKTQPVPDAQGHVWVTCIYELSYPHCRGVVALLDTRTGQALWQRELNSAQELNDPGATVHPLVGGDAIVAAPPAGGLGSTSIQRRSGATGAIIWAKEFTGFYGDYRSLSWLVNEQHSHLRWLDLYVDGPANLIGNRSIWAGQCDGTGGFLRAMSGVSGRTRFRLPRWQLILWA
jgi:hypothetical protein